MLALFMTMAMLLSLMPTAALAAVQKPSGVQSNLVIGILDDANASGEGEFPNEPSVTGYDYYYLTSNYGLATGIWQVNFTNNVSNYIDTNAFWLDDRVVVNEDRNAYGIYNPAGFALSGEDSDPLFKPGFIDETAVIEAWMGAEGIRNEPASNYKLLVYVLKYETGWNAGYHMDIKVVRSNNVTLSYNANKPDGVTVDVTVPSSVSVAPGSSEEVENMPNSSRTLRVGNLTYEFDGWNTEDDGSGEDYDAGDEITVSADTILYAQWKVANTYTVTWVDYNEETLHTETNVPYGDKITHPANPTRPSTGDTEYTFSHWAVKSGSYNEATGVTNNVTFIAVYDEEAITYTAAVEVVLNGTFNANGEKLTGENADIDVMVPGAEDKLYLKRVDGIGDYIELEKDSPGIYTNDAVSNGNYYIYLKNGSKYEKVGTQELTINNADRTRYLPYYGVSYDNGEALENVDVPDTEYYYIGSDVTVADALTWEDHIFLGWDEDEDKVVDYDPGDTISIITRAHELTALWGEINYAKVNLTVTVNHALGTGVDPDLATGGFGPMVIDLTYRANENKPYVEVVGKEVTDADWFDGNHDNNTQTTVNYTYTDLDFDKLDINYEYAANVFLEHYRVDDWDVDVAVDDTNGDTVYNVEITLQYDPDLFTLKYTVVADESIPDDLIPQAVDIKIGSWDARVAGEWAPISRHVNSTVDVKFDEGDADPQREGSGSYGVPVWDDQHTTRYYYRVSVAGLTLHDGTEVTVDSAAENGNVNYISKADNADRYGPGVFTAESHVDHENGRIPDSATELYGAYGEEASGGGYTQKGDITVTVYMNAYEVVFDLGGAEGTIEPVNNVLTIPTDLPTPTRTGYTFDGWYTDPEDDTTKVNGGEYIYRLDNTLLPDDEYDDIILFARWKSNFTVKGTVVVNLGFPCTDDESRTVNVALQMKRSDGTYYVTEFDQDVSIHPVVTAGYENYAIGEYEFENVPDIGQYRVYVLVSQEGGTVKYQNEPASLSPNNLYVETSYSDDAYTVNRGDNNPAEAVVNIYMRANPFDLGYMIDTSAIGAGYRPTGSITLDLRHDHVNAAGTKTYEVIDDKLVVNMDEHTDGVSDIATHNVPRYHASGRLYDYVISVLTYNLPEGAALDDGHGWTGRHYYHYTSNESFSAPFAIHYEGPANYSATANGDGLNQDVTLKAVFEPNKYDITYDLDGGYWPAGIAATVPSQHTWSYDTEIPTPARLGYTFKGWIATAASEADVFDETNKKIPGNVWEDVTLTAKWEATSVAYTVEYYYDGVHKPEHNVTDSADFGTVIDTYPDKSGEGYTLYGVQNLPLTIGVEPAANVIRVFYISSNTALTVEKETAWTTAKVGDTVIWRITVTNNLDVAQTITVEDILEGAVGAATVKDADLVITDNTDITLAANETKVFTATYVVQLGDSGKTLLNKVIVSGNGDPTGDISDDVEVDPAVTVEKTVDKTSAEVGDKLIYTITVTNNSSITLENLTVVDEMLNQTVTIETLAAGDTWTEEYEYTVKSSDAGKSLINTVVVKSGDQELGEDDSETTEVKVYGPALQITKSVSKTKVEVGDTITYTITVKNTGNVALTNVVVTDDFIKGGDQDRTWTIDTLAVDESKTFTFNYNTVNADRNGLKNVAVASGTAPGGDTVTDTTDSVDVGVEREPVTPVGPSKPQLNMADHYAYIVGYPDGLVHPERNITRAEVATIFFRMLLDESREYFWAQENDFTDVPADKWFNNAISTLANANLINGYPDGSYKPNANITRAEFATIAIRFFLEEDVEIEENNLTDVKGHWAEANIDLAYALGLITGYPDGTFRPNQLITRAEAMTIVNRVLKRAPHKDHLLEAMIQWPDNLNKDVWYYADVQEATNSHEFHMNKENEYEIWTELLPVRDWAALEREWSEHNSSKNPGEVVDININTPEAGDEADDNGTLELN